MKTVITKEILENLLEQGLSGNQIGKQLGYCSNTIRVQSLYKCRWVK